MSTRTVLSYVGLAVGAYFGNPQLGWAIGSAIGNAVDPQIIRGPSIGDIANQTSQEGVPRPIVFALSQPMAGNIIASGEPQVVRRRDTQGKGGPKVETESVYRTYAIGICEGPITRVVRVWRNGQLVYDQLIFDPQFIADQLLDSFREAMTGNNQTFAQRARFFLGDWDQLPSPDLEREFGVGTTPAHRGTAYMVMDNEDLTDFRGAIPQYQFQVERCEGEYVTSRVYPLNDMVAIDIAGDIRERFQPDLRERLDIGGDLIAGTHQTIVVEYEQPGEDAIEIAGAILHGDIGSITFDEYADGEPEALDIAGTLLSGGLNETVVTYDNGEPEAMDIAGDLIGGDLT